jgi:hypothetical protein
LKRNESPGLERGSSLSSESSGRAHSIDPDHAELERMNRSVAPLVGTDHPIDRGGGVAGSGVQNLRESQAVTRAVGPYQQKQKDGSGEGHEPCFHDDSLSELDKRHILRITPKPSHVFHRRSVERENGRWSMTLPQSFSGMAGHSSEWERADSRAIVPASSAADVIACAVGNHALIRSAPQGRQAEPVLAGLRAIFYSRAGVRGGT